MIEHVWLSRTLLLLDEQFGFECDHLHTDENAFINVLRRFKLGANVSDTEMPDVMWCSDAQDDRKSCLPHLFKVDAFLTVSQQAKDLLEDFDLGAARFIPVRLLHGDKTTPWPGPHYFLYMPDRITAFAPDLSRRFDAARYDDDNHIGTIPFDTADYDISVCANALTGQDMWQDNSLLWSLFFTDRAMAAVRKAGLMGEMQVTRCPVVA